MSPAISNETNIYEFAASAGALEGFLYHKKSMQPGQISKWVDNLVEAYGLLPRETRDEIQPSIDQTIGRALRSLSPLLGDDHEIVQKLASIVAGPLPDSADDFRMKKWFQNE